MANQPKDRINFISRDVIHTLGDKKLNVPKEEANKPKVTPRSKFTRAERETEPEVKDLIKNGNQACTKPITRIGNKYGAKRRYTPTKMRNKINDYFTFCEKKDKVPSIKGMMLYMKMAPDQIYTYQKYPEFTDLLMTARMIIQEWVEEDVYKTKGQASGKLAYMQNLHQWSNKTETEVVNRDLSVEEATAKIEMLAPALLELLKNSNVLNQLLPPQAQVIDAVEDKNE